MINALLLTLAVISAPPADYALVPVYDYVLIPIERSVVVKRTVIALPPVRVAPPPTVVRRTYATPSPRVIRYVAPPSDYYYLPPSLYPGRTVIYGSGSCASGTCR